MAIISPRCHEPRRMLKKTASRGRTVRTDSRQNKDDRIRKYHTLHRTRSSRCRELLKPASRALKFELQRRDPNPSKLEILVRIHRVSSEIGWKKRGGGGVRYSEPSCHSRVMQWNGQAHHAALVCLVEPDQRNRPEQPAGCLRFTIHTSPLCRRAEARRERRTVFQQPARSAQA